MSGKTILGLGVVLIAAIAAYFLVPRNEPAGPGGTMRSAEADAGAGGQGAPLAKVAVPARLSAEAQIGKRGFDAKCAQCHGQNAAGQNGIAPPLVHQIYRPAHHADAAFFFAARNGVRAHHWNFGNMPPIAGLTDADIKYIVRYVRELQRENGIN